MLPDFGGIASSRLLLVGLGPKAQFSRRAWRRALQHAVAALLKTRIATVALALERPDLDDYYLGRSSAELVGASLYRVNDFKTARKPKPPALARVLVGPIDTGHLAEARRGLTAGAALAASAQLLRNLGNLPANVCTPRYLANQARDLERLYRRLKVRDSMRRASSACTWVAFSR